MRPELLGDIFPRHG